MSRRAFFKICFGAAATAGLAAVAAGRRQPRTQPRPEHNPFAYDIESLKHIDADKVLYAEKTPLPVPRQPPRYLAFDSAQTLIVAGDTAVSRFRTDGTLLGMFDVDVPAHCVAALASGRIVVAGRDQVAIYRDDGARLARWSSLGEQAVISGIAAYAEQVVIADYGTKQLWLFTSDGNLLRFIKPRTADNRPEDFLIPSPFLDVAVDRDGSIWTMNPGRHRLIRFAPDGRQLQAWGRFGFDIEGFSGCCNPTHVAVTPAGDIVTAEKGLARVKLYDAAGVFKGVVAGPEHFNEGVTGLSVAVAASGDIYVADPLRRQVRVFAPKRISV